MTVRTYIMNESSAVWCVGPLRCGSRGINMALGTGVILLQVSKLDSQFQRETVYWPWDHNYTSSFHTPRVHFGKVTDVRFHFSFWMRISWERGIVGRRRKVAQTFGIKSAIFMASLHVPCIEMLCLCSIKNSWAAFHALKCGFLKWRCTTESVYVWAKHGTVIW